AFNRVLASEYGTEQQHSHIGKTTGGIEAIGDFTGVPAECGRQIAVTSVEAGDDVVQRRAYFVLVEGQDARQHCTRAGVLALETLLPWHEQPRDESRPVGREPLRAPRDQPALHRSHCRPVDEFRACCKVEITARVDSAPWLQFTPSVCSPSYPPPVSGSHIGSPASLSPMNHAAAAVMPSRQTGLVSTAAARAHASASVDTSMGC